MGTESENSVSFFRFEDLRIYAKSLDYTKWVHGVINMFPNESQNNLGNNFVKSAQAIALNIAEGSARNKSQFIYYLKMAKSAVRECVVYTAICHDQQLFSDENNEQSRNQLMELTKMIGSLIASLQRSVPNLKEEDED
jgi:four helix bundle protein